MFFSCFDFSCFEQWSQRAPSRGNSKDIIHYTQLWHTFFKLMNFINSFCVFSFLPLDFAHRTASVHAAINIRHIFLVNYIQIFDAKKAYQLHQTWIHFSNNYGNILRFSLVACCLLFPIVLRGTATKCGLKSKLLCRQQMSFEICLQSRNMPSFTPLGFEAVHIQHTLLPRNGLAGARWEMRADDARESMRFSEYF